LLGVCRRSAPAPWRTARFLVNHTPASALPPVSPRRLRPGAV